LAINDIYDGQLLRPIWFHGVLIASIHHYSAGVVVLHVIVDQSIYVFDEVVPLLGFPSVAALIIRNAKEPFGKKAGERSFFHQDIVTGL